MAGLKAAKNHNRLFTNKKYGFFRLGNEQSRSFGALQPRSRFCSDETCKTSKHTNKKQKTVLKSGASTKIGFSKNGAGLLATRPEQASRL
ncbi:hypothetical protein [Pedobacter sp. KACC 23697]|uniref:Uncharacterized protein n=1 Tax=Pedobacter sp. KACC 23697 TaxID=3149230 RepID=A0AAU7K0K3_9SPHI